MSEIPYYFDTPVPSDFRKNGWFKNLKTLAFVTWAFSRCSTKSHSVCHDGKKIDLLPYQFIFGRLKCSEDTGLTEDEVRIQQKSMEKATFLKKCPNKTPNRFTIYEWSTSAFSIIDPQLKTQQTPNSPPTEPHKLEPRTKTIDLKEQPNLTFPFEKVGSLVGSVFSCLVSVEKLTPDEKINLSATFDEVDLIRAVAVMNEYKKPIKYFKKFIENAIEDKWEPKEQPKFTLSDNAEKNKERLFSYAEYSKEKLRNKDLLIKDMIDHALFGHIKIYYESKTFNNEVGEARKLFNLLDNILNIRKSEPEEDKVVQFKQLSNILIETKQTF